MSQECPGVEVSYYVLDGGSTDSSADIIRSYEPKLAYFRSRKDDGQSAAIAEGLAMGSGEIVAWINSDDAYPAGAFQKVAAFFSVHPDVDVLYGDCLMIDAHSVPVGLGTHVPVTWKDLFETPYLINQEATFMRRSLYARVGGVDPSYWGAMDYDLWLRLFREGKSTYLPEILGMHRMLEGQKSSSSERYVDEMKRARENFGRRYSITLSEWPFSEAGRKRLLTKWEQQSRPILEWIKEGCSEDAFNGAVLDIWQRYSRNGILPVRGTTSFGWTGPEALYVIDKQTLGPTMDWVFSAPVPRLCAHRLYLNLDGKSWDIDLKRPISITLPLSSNKRFSVFRITADRYFVPALENWGPAYFSLSVVSCPKPGGEHIISVQSMPNIPPVIFFSKLGVSEKDSTDTVKYPAGTLSDSKASGLKTHIKNTPLRIAFFSSSTAGVGSGCEHLIYNTAKALIARGHDARVYVMNSQMDDNPPFFVRRLPTFPLEKIIERVLSRLTGWNDIFFPSTALLRISRWLRSADIWHFHNLHAHYVSIPLLGLVSWTKRIVLSPVDQFLSTGYCPYAMGCERYLHGCGSCPRLAEPYPGISRDATRLLWHLKRIFFRSSKVNMLFHTQALASHYQATFVGQRPGRVLHYGVDINSNRKISPIVCADRLGVSLGSRFVVGLFHSYITDPRKGILPIIKALGDLDSQNPDEFELLVVGRGSDEVKDIVPSGLKITSLPFLRYPHELCNALNLCDALLYPTQAENLSLTCLCSLACGVPVITYDVGGQKEAVLHNVNGFVVALNDTEAMLAALMKIVSDPELLKRLSEGARRTAEELFDFDRYIDELLSYYYEQM